MKVIRSAVLAILWVLVMVVPAFAQVVAPKFEVGDRWDWTRTDKSNGEVKGQFSQTVARVSADVVQMEVSTMNNGTVVQDYTPQGNMVSMPGRQYSPDLPYLRFPLAVGQKWSVSYTITSGGRQLRETIEAKVVVEESVKVPAGTFTTFKIEYTTWDERSTAFREVHWYSPELKRMVMRDVEERVRGGGKGAIWRDVLQTYSLAGKTASN